MTAPHHLAAQSGLAVLRDGGNAIEAMVAGAASGDVLVFYFSGHGSQLPDDRAGDPGANRKCLGD